MSSAPSLTDVASTMPPAAVPESAACAVCPHALAEHDRISLRFCQATGAHRTEGTATRGCVCPA